MPSITFPLEVEETILELLAADEDDEGHSALKTCSLVCQAFLPICRKYLFGSIVINAHNSRSPPFHAFERLLRETPEIADYVRTLEYTFRIGDLTSPSIIRSIQESLMRISRLEFLTLRVLCRGRDLFRFDWSNNPIRPALLHLLHLPTLTHFMVTGIKDFIISDLIPCVNLKYLEIGNMTMAAENTFPPILPAHLIQLNEFVARYRCSGPAIMKLCTVRRPDGQPIIDFGSLSKITLCIDYQNEVSQELFGLCHALTDVDIACKWYLHCNRQDI